MVKAESFRTEMGRVNAGKAGVEGNDEGQHTRYRSRITRMREWLCERNNRKYLINVEVGFLGGER
jgi:hypothetical protein